MTGRIEAEACVSRFLARRDHSTGELRKKLSKRGFEAGIIEDVIAACVATGWVDDRKFAAHQAQLLAAQGWGPLRIRLKLQNHGVDSDLVSETLDNLEADWLAGARAKLERKFPDFGPDDAPRAYRFLTNRGFRPATARRVIFDD